MSQPQYAPEALPIQLSPGDSATASVRLVPPADGSVTASIAGGDALVFVESVSATRYEWRDANPDEQAQHGPGFGHGPGKVPPPKKILVPVDLGSTDGAVPLAVPAGCTVSVTVKATVPAAHATGLYMATLSISGTTWDPISVPVSLLVGLELAPVNVVPGAILLAAKPGETAIGGCMIDGTPSAAKVLVHLAKADPLIQLTAVLYRPETRPATDDELAHMPIVMRAKAKKDGITQYREIGRTDGTTPLDVPRGARLTMNVACSVPAENPPDSDFNTLLIEGTTWQRVEVPIEFMIGLVTVTLVPDSPAIAQGDSAPLQATITSVAGPATDVAFAMDPAKFGRVFPSIVNLARGATITPTLNLAIDPETPLGTYPVGIDVLTFLGSQLQMVAITLTVLPARIDVQALGNSTRVFQGDRFTWDVRLVSRGGYKKLTFSPALLPSGVSIVTPMWEHYGAADVTLTIEFVVGPDADPVNKRIIVLGWDAGDGVHKGFIDGVVGIMMKPASRTFSANIETPDATALGGHIDLTVKNDGTAHFTGEMHDSGALNYTFSVHALLVSADGKLAVMAQKSGKVEGTEALIDIRRSFTWDETTTSPFTGTSWKAIRSATLSVSKSYEIAGVVGTLENLAADVIEFVLGLAILAPFVPGGAGIICLLMIGTELGQLYGVRVLGPDGLVGVLAAAGAAILVGPTMMIPAFIAGAFAAEALIKHRLLTDKEVAFAHTVFGDTIPYSRVIVTNLIGVSSRAITVPNADSDILLNIGAGHDVSLDTYVPSGSTKYTTPGELLIHELTHAWQIAHAPFVHDYFWSGVKDQLSGSSSYQYGPADLAWSDFDIEAQATIVNEWFSGSISNCASWPAGVKRKPKDPADPYFTYIANNILLGVW
jgi:hypothetical protein